LKIILNGQGNFEPLKALTINSKTVTISKEDENEYE